MAISNLQLYPGAVDFPASNPATYAVEAGTDPDRIGLAFDASTNEAATFPFVMPQSYGGGTLTLVVTGKMASATTGDVDLDAEVEARSAGEALDADSFDTANSTDNTTVPGTAGLSFEVSITLTNKDSVAVGDLVRLRLTRDAVSDTATGDVEIYGVDLRES